MKKFIIGATAALMNAVLDALAPLGIEALDMPYQPARVWEAIQAARAAQPEVKEPCRAS